MSEQDRTFWEDIYRQAPRPGWDMGRATPVLAELLGLPACRESGPAWVVPGCGFGHDAAELARRGFQVTGMDFALAAVQGARERYGDLVRWVQEDWFAPSVDVYDGIFDYTCFAAMEPDRRGAYLDACARRLRPGGLWLAGCFHTVTTPPGPPYAMTLDEVRRLVEPRFEVLHLDHATLSHPRRQGREFLVAARFQG